MDFSASNVVSGSQKCIQREMSCDANAENTTSNFHEASGVNTLHQNEASTEGEPSLDSSPSKEIYNIDKCLKSTVEPNHVQKGSDWSQKSSESYLNQTSIGNNSRFQDNGATPSSGQYYSWSSGVNANQGSGVNNHWDGHSSAVTQNQQHPAHSSSGTYQHAPRGNYYTPITTQHHQPVSAPETIWVPFSLNTLQQLITEQQRAEQRRQLKAMALQDGIDRNRAEMSVIEERCFLNTARIAQIERELARRYARSEEDSRSSDADTSTLALLENADEFEAMLTASGIPLALKVELLAHARSLREEMRSHQSLIGQYRQRIRRNDVHIATIQKQIEELEEEDRVKRVKLEHSDSSGSIV